MANIITGLDIGSSQIKCVVAEEKKDGLSIITAIKHPSSGMRRGLLVNVEDATRILRDLVVDLQKISKKTVHNIFVNVNGENIKPRSSRGVVVVSRPDQEIQQDDIEKVIQGSRAVKLSPNYLILHNIVREYFIDDVGDIHDPLGMTGNRLEVSTLIIEAFSPHFNLLVKSLERVGMRIGGLIFSPLAAARATLTKKQKDLGVLMIDFGFGTTTMAFFEENKVTHAKSLPVGVGHITNDIAIGFKISIEAAEKLKLTHGFALAREVPRRETIELVDFEPTAKGGVSKRFLAEIIEIRVAEILDLVNNELKELGGGAQFPAGVVITGGGVKLAGMVELVRQELRLPVQVGYPELEGFEILNPTHQKLLDDPEFSTAVGLVLWADSENRESGGSIGGVRKFLRNLVP